MSLSLLGRVVAVSGIVASLGTGALQAGEPVGAVLERVHVRQLAPFTTQVAFPFGTLPGLCGVSGSYALHSDPSHGQLSKLGGVLTYQPGTDFWSLGTDSFDYTAVQNGTTQYCAVVLVAARPPVRPEPLVFPPGGTGPLSSVWWTFSGQGVYTCNAANECAPIPPPHGGGASSGGGGIKVRVPPGGGPVVPDAPQAAVFTGTSTEGAGQVRLELGSTRGQVTITAALDDGVTSHTTTPTVLAPGLRHIDLDWWSASALSQSGLRLLVDGRDKGAPSGALSWPSQFDIDTASSATENVAIESVYMREQVGELDGLVGATTRLRTDFNGGLDPWQGSESSTVRRVSATEAARGSELALGWPTATPVLEAEIEPTDVLNLRFRLLSQRANSGAVAFLSLDGQGSSSEVVSLSVVREPGLPPRLEATVRSEGSTQSLAVPLTPDTSNRVAVQWRSPSPATESDPAPADGILRIWVGGGQPVETAELALGGHRLVKSLRLGAHSFTGAGTLYVDDVEVWY